MKISLLSTFVRVLALTVPSVFGVALYRNGNASKACTKIRTPKDYDDPVDGIVPANPTKGVRYIFSTPFCVHSKFVS